MHHIFFNCWSKEVSVHDKVDFLMLNMMKSNLWYTNPFPISLSLNCILNHLSVSFTDFITFIQTQWNVWALTVLTIDLGPILVISNIVTRFTGPTHSLSLNVRQPVRSGMPVYRKGQWPHNISAPVCSHCSEQCTRSHVTHNTQLPHLPSVSGTHFTNNFSFRIQTLWKFCFALIKSLVIRLQQMFTSHNSTAVMPGAKFIVITLLEFWYEQRLINFHPIWLVMVISLVEWVPGPIDVRSSAMFRISSRLSYVIHGLIITWSKLK